MRRTSILAVCRGIPGSSFADLLVQNPHLIARFHLNEIDQNVMFIRSSEGPYACLKTFTASLKREHVCSGCKLLRRRLVETQYRLKKHPAACRPARVRSSRKRQRSSELPFEAAANIPLPFQPSQRRWTEAHGGLSGLFTFVDVSTPEG